MFEWTAFDLSFVYFFDIYFIAAFDVVLFLKILIFGVNRLLLFL